jgi:outer membrane lipoprotein-sorting protein
MRLLDARREDIFMVPFHGVVAFRQMVRLRILSAVAVALVATCISVQAQEAQLKTADAVLEGYKRALGGSEAVQKVQSMTVHGEAESSARLGKSTFVYYARPFKSLFKVTRADGTEITTGFDGKVSWTITPQGASIDKETPVDANRRDADLQYALHQPDYFRKLELAGVADFGGHRCYWLHGTTNWGKDNNQFYDTATGLLVGYRFESDDASKTITIALFKDYKSFGGPLMATKNVSRTGDRSQTFTYKSVSYEPLADSLFELPEAVKRLLK